MNLCVLSILLMVAILSWSGQASATPFFFNTGDVDGKIATASRPESAGKIEIESADDFIVSGGTLKLNSATFQGLLPAGASLGTVSAVRVEIYRVFPKDSTNPPSGNVPTRMNSPSDVAFDTRESSTGGLTFTQGIIAPSFTAGNSVLNGINKSPNQLTLGEGAVTGERVQFNVLFSTPITLPTDHYFFVPQVELTSGEFFWLSSVRPIVSPGTLFAPDLQSWIRNANLDPDWLRIGTDIVGGTMFNAAFTLDGDLSPVPEPATLLLVGTSMTGLAFTGRWRRRQK